jgi:hypothetical protein
MDNCIGRTLGYPGETTREIYGERDSKATILEQMPVPTALEGKIQYFHGLSVRFAGSESGPSRA